MLLLFAKFLFDYMGAKGAHKKKLAFLAELSAKGEGGLAPQQLRNAIYFLFKKKREVLK